MCARDSRGFSSVRSGMNLDRVDLIAFASAERVYSENIWFMLCARNQWRVGLV